MNYADDFVICCRPGNAAQALARMSVLMTRLGLDVNTAKTRIAGLPEESFDFLGYTIGRFFGKDGRPYIGTRPSKKSVKSLLRRIHARTSRQWYIDEPKNTVARISTLLRGWCGYFNQGPVMDIYDRIRMYTDRRVRRWLMRRTGKPGAGFRQIPDAYLYEVLGLYRIPRRRADLPRWDGRKPDAVALHVRFDERRLETEPRSELRHRQFAKAAGQQQLLETYRQCASRRLYRSRCGRRPGSGRGRPNG